MDRSTLFNKPLKRFVAYAKMFPADRFDPNVFIVTDTFGIVTAVGPLGLVYLAFLKEYKIRKKRINSHGLSFRGKTLERKKEVGYNAIALHFGLPSARVVESILHPDFYRDGMTINKMVYRIETMLRRFLTYKLNERYAKFFKWFDNAFKHVPDRPYRDVYKSYIVSARPKEFGFFPYAFRLIENITLKDFYDKQNKSTRRRSLLKTSDSTD